jgi:hypothetical protein
MKGTRSLSFLTILGLALSAPLVHAQKSGYMPNGADQSAQRASVIQLIANPAAYDGKKVRLIGFLRLEFEGNGLYLHKEDFDHGITENALWVDAPRDMTKEQRDAVNTQYVICEGTFKAKGHGHMGMFSGELANVTRIQVWASREAVQNIMNTPKP